MMQILPLDGTTVLRFLRSTAFTQALAESVTVEWKSNPQSWNPLEWNPLHTVSKLWGNVDAGTAQLNMASGKELLLRTQQLLEGHLRRFDVAMGEGPIAVFTLLNRLQTIRDHRVKDIHAALRDVHEVNLTIFNELSKAMATAGFIAASATIALSVIGVCVTGCALALGTSAALGSAGAAAGATSWAAAAGSAGWVGTGYGIAGSLIKSWNQAPAAGAIVISPAVDGVGAEFLKWNDWADKGLELLQNKAGQNIELQQRAVAFLNGAIRRRAQALMTTAAGSSQQLAQNTLDRLTAANYKANTAIAKSRGAFAGLGVLRGFMCVYVAYNDIKGALEQYEETKKAANEAWGQ